MLAIAVGLGYDKCFDAGITETCFTRFAVVSTKEEKERKQ